MNYFDIWKNISTKFQKMFIKKCWKLSRWELVFGGPLEKSILTVTRITRDNFIQNQKIIYFLLVRENSSWLNEKFFFKLKFEFLAELFAKQYDFRYKLGHVLARKISCNKKKNPPFNHKSILFKRSVQNSNKIGALVFEKSRPPTWKIQFWEKHV